MKKMVAFRNCDRMYNRSLRGAILVMDVMILYLMKLPETARLLVSMVSHRFIQLLDRNGYPFWRKIIRINESERLGFVKNFIQHADMTVVKIFIVK
jgi:hypothetical protein